MTSSKDPAAQSSHICPWWLAYTFDNPLRRLVHDPQLMLGAMVREGMIVADIGCGMGYFSIAMARMIGDRGKVLAVDLQQEMLDIMGKRALKAGVSDRIRPVQASADDIRIRGPVDFVLAFWMVHEVPDIPRFFRQVRSVLAPEGRVLYAEPRMHVNQERFNEILHHAREAGFRTDNAPVVRISRAAVLMPFTVPA